MIEGTADPEVERDAAWVACYTMVNREKQVDAYLRRRGIRSYLPLVTRMRQWHDRKKKLHQPLFPSYVFARVSPRSLDTVLATPGVAAVVRMAGRPVAIAEADIDNIERFARALTAVGAEPPRVTLEVGRRARIVAGAFAGVCGVVVAQRGDTRVLVGLESLGLGFGVDVPVSSLELQPSPAAEPPQSPHSDSAEMISVPYPRHQPGFARGA
jgi:transcription antitermination factor NusG